MKEAHSSQALRDVWGWGRGGGEGSGRTRLDSVPAYLPLSPGGLAELGLVWVGMVPSPSIWIDPDAPGG